MRIGTRVMDSRVQPFALDDLRGAPSAARFAEQLCAASPGVPAFDVKLRTYGVTSELASTVTGEKRSTPPGCGDMAAKRARSMPAKLVPRLKLEAFEASTSSALDSSRSSAVKSHTRRCREKVNEKFERLLEALPPPPNGVEVKHKAQILEYTIRVFRHYIARRAALNIDIALASPAALARWAAARGSQTLHSLLDDFSALYARKHHWPYVETWTGSPLSLATAQVCDDKSPAAEQLRVFGARARELAPHSPQAPLGLIQRAAAAQRPEWLPAPRGDPFAFARAGLAAQAGLEVALAVPVIARGCEPPVAVLLFADVKERDYSSVEVARLCEFANLVASCNTRRDDDKQQQLQEHPQQPAPSTQQDDDAFDSHDLPFVLDAASSPAPPPLLTHASAGHGFADFYSVPQVDLGGLCM